MKMNMKMVKKTRYRKPPILLSQKEIVKRINKSTRKSYQYFDLLIKKGALNG